MKPSALLFALSQLATLGLAKGHGHHDHQRFHNVQQHGNQTMSKLSSAEKLLESGQRAMARANQHIVANPRRNRLEVLNSTGLADAKRPPPLLDYRHNETQSLHRRAGGNATGTDSSEDDARYKVPDELIAAARQLSEAWHVPSEKMEYNEYDAATDRLKQVYKYEVNDTNMMPPVLSHGDGLTYRVDEPPSAFRYSDNTTDVVDTKYATLENEHKPEKRQEASSWWLSNMQQTGSSPFAPAGYQVWRNVKDFGAKGDGKADDTDAINKAISDGGRCGGGSCTGSTIYPATVYFPPGTYKVSSSIIQYYNTEFIGNPLDLPRIVAAPSFVGLGVITSNVYTGESSEWYLNQNNFLRSVRNFIIDIRATPQWAQVCGIHWQVAQGTSLENIHFYMTKPKDDPETTHQGIYMENGSGGFLSDLYFVGGKFGAYMGNQQFTGSGLYFSDAETAIQIHWDWGWTLQNVVVDNCDVGITIVGGAGGPMSNGQGIGSLLVTDMRMHYGRVAISTSIMSDNSTALLLSNSGFYYVDTIVEDTPKKQVLLAGGKRTHNVESWGFGRVTSADGSTAFLNGAALDSASRDKSLVVGGRKQFFTRRRPKYDDLGPSEILDARKFGARGDGKSDDTAVLNYLFSAAANMSAVVYIPFGVYIIKDTVEIPVGSRVIGQAWPQIMATGSKFSNMQKPRVAVRVGRPGQEGVVEIQSMMVTVKGATAGAIMMEWNVHESSQGSAGLWDTHFRVGGAKGTGLTAEDCPKLTGKVNKNCIAASLMLHLTAESSAYLENVWMWTADHDFDTKDQTQLDVYVGRGLLIESNGPTWLWGTSVEHCVLYQYQLSGAKNVVMGLIQTESPYFQSMPTAPEPFRVGAFPNDPAFHDCSKSSKTCGVSWAVRLLDSEDIHILSAGLYSFFSRYDQSCIKSDRHDCQDRLFYTEESFNIWVHNLVTLGSLEMISPLNGTATLGKPNKNGFASSLLAWMGGARQLTGKRKFGGYNIHDDETIGLDGFPTSCQNALKALVRCDQLTKEWTHHEYHGTLEEGEDIDSACDKGCLQSIEDWRRAVTIYCDGCAWENGATPEVFGSFISYGLNETCQTEKSTGKNCNDVIMDFSSGDALDDMPDSELCSSCFLDRLKMMQSSPYSAYRQVGFYQDALQAAIKRCSLSNQPTATKESPFPTATPEETLCLSGVHHYTQADDTCDSLALKYNVSSAAIFNSNPNILDCYKVVQDVEICLPLPCELYELEEEETCVDVRYNTGIGMTALRNLNPWIKRDCSNLQSATETLGRILCVSEPGGSYAFNLTQEESVDPAYPEYAPKVVQPPEDAVLAANTTTKCGRWHKAEHGDECGNVLSRYHISLLAFNYANPSIARDNCTGSLTAGLTYCVGPTMDFLTPDAPIPEYYQYGCFARNTAVANKSVLQYGERNYTESMSTLLCMALCWSESHYVFGLENGDTCLCDNSLRIGSKILDDDKCNVKCGGNSSTSCGGEGAVEVYSLQTTLPVESESLGCFSSTESSPVLQQKKKVDDKNDMSIQTCGSICTTAGHTMFALSEGSICICGDSMTDAKKIDKTENCQVDCSGGWGDYCGGDGFAEVHSTQPVDKKSAKRSA